MEIHDYATTILTGTRIEDKLIPIGRVTDEKPGTPWEIPCNPGRPAGLQFRETKVKHPFPKLSSLEDERARGQVLHFFANHELLALELMALTLLRFPEASQRFRRTLVATMRDEQKHLSLYLSQMKTLGVEFGEIPVNGFFWSLISPMISPTDFVARMSLTFEQANLDFSLFYCEAFKRIGDTQCATIMEEVLRDEIRHVRHGLEYFNQWRDSTKSLWDCHQDALPFPLTLARAKGSVCFTQTHRQDAGLPDDYIQKLSTFQHSKGRSPTVYFFNPLTELMLVTVPERETKKSAAVQFQRETETLPMFLAAQDDVVLVQSSPSTSFLSSLNALGFRTPEFVQYTQLKGQIRVDDTFTQRKLKALSPWGVDPQIARFLEPLEAQLISQAPLKSRVEHHRKLSSKAWLAENYLDLLADLGEAHPLENLTETTPHVADTTDRVVQVRDALFASGYDIVGIKAAFGTAGRNSMRFVRGKNHLNEMRWVQKVIEAQGQVIIEPWYERLADFSHLFTVKNAGACIHHGMTQFSTDISGRYRGTFLGRFGSSWHSDVSDFILRNPKHQNWLKKLCVDLCDSVAKKMSAEGYTGRAGIDFMVVRDKGRVKLRIPLELNSRATMGHISLALRRRLAPKTIGFWAWLTASDLRRSAYTEFSELLTDLARTLPLQTEDGCGRIVQGVIPTTDSTRVQSVATCLVVAEDIRDVARAFLSVGLENPFEVSATSLYTLRHPDSI